MDILKGYRYGDQNLTLHLDPTYLSCVKIWNWLDLRIESY